MKYLEPSGEQSLIPLIISVRAETARLLSEMAREMGVSLDEVLSFIAEDAVIGLESNSKALEDIFIPE